MNSAYEKVKDHLLKELEGIAKVKAPSTAYLEALKDIQDEVDAWFETSIDAAEGDVERAKGEAS